MFKTGMIINYDDKLVGYIIYPSLIVWSDPKLNPNSYLLPIWDNIAISSQHCIITDIFV